MGTFMHAVEGEMLCQSTDAKHVPYFNAPIYLENKSQIGKVDEILGPINEVYFTVKMDPGMVATSFKSDDKVYISGEKLLPIERFLPKPKSTAPIIIRFVSHQHASMLVQSASQRFSRSSKPTRFFSFRQTHLRSHYR
ncbi:ribonucleoprotein complex subunit 1 [Pseudozyma hubeiensis SY62]|uniref:H/ACA ribonucleoprotein complex subunit n=1 Tax=Pseudozyma hubeiensis (strain SY62) TaxID=1305764 RepID=R9P9V9_PSEHS|nr:ribonucleoprotein complex subunit 1 [Pseudozyma hubeiensis SY62]GAC94835.1 ribonucleoprotein complex subunit 1 [Pseudozyma hubeiensis SY62]